MPNNLASAKTDRTGERTEIAEAPGLVCNALQFAAAFRTFWQTRTIPAPSECLRINWLSAR
jgi:hypothetical protein